MYKMPEFYMISDRKIFSRFFSGGGDTCPIAPSPISFAYTPYIHTHTFST